MKNLFYLLFVLPLLFSCVASEEKSKEKPKLCDCQNNYFKDIEDAMNFGKTEPSDFVKECEKYYSVEELINADCGISNYDPNFKAK